MEVIFNVVYVIIGLLLLIVSALLHKIGTIRKWEIELQKEVSSDE